MSGLLLHPDDQTIFYALGSTVVIKPLLKDEQSFLQCGNGEGTISCMALSQNGQYLAAGQETQPGFRVHVIQIFFFFLYASVWLWNLEKKEIAHRFDIFQSKVQAVMFSPTGKYLAALGDERNNNLVIFDALTGKALCGSPAANEVALCLRYANHTDDILITAGKYNLRVWKRSDLLFCSECYAAYTICGVFLVFWQKKNSLMKKKKLQPTNCQLGHLKRVFNCIAIEKNDDIAYVGTTSGDVLQISLKNALLQKKTLSTIKSITLEGKVTSLVLNLPKDHFFVGTDKAMMYLVRLEDFDRINDLCFPHDCSQLFVTASTNDIRVWNAKNGNELLRIKVPNLECHCVKLAKNGLSIISGWSDGKIRAFYPESGKTMFTIENAHKGKVTALALSSDGSKLVTGGTDSNVRVWSITPNKQSMLESFKEHQNSISSITVSKTFL
ncbi:ubiquitin specific protease 43 [Reticulomyxa filosa]|uniref:Cilia- and flagella-associated protein 52 n=1 Tax=Reticulomyxa filosa TaxID=46433 RepID=X6N5R6_RETFI|nr:ubiquitin specific protease 43 [Reticulomyxa filosa]|eukprot:ETO21094.1 ubiquitin specific protease 43 [Reticulomyxa filosa]